MTQRSMGLPEYHGPAFFGVRPGNPVFLPLPVSGKQVAVSALKLPSGIRFEEDRKILSGLLDSPEREQTAHFSAENADGKIFFNVTFKVGEDILLTPPMGWNSWYCFSESVSDAKIREVAKAMVERGLADYGWNWINIDDCYQGERGGPFQALQGNERFPDFYALAENLHSLGLRLGIYSTPWISTYAGFRGGSSDGGLENLMAIPEPERLQKHQLFGRWPGGSERGQYRIGSEWLLPNDVKQWADWKVDYVKVDWYPNDIPTTRKIADLLRRCGRDIALSLSNNTQFPLASEIAKYANAWRISGDVHDSFDSIRRIGFESAPLWAPFGAPGHWNDLDMLQIGAIGIPNRQNTVYKPSSLSYEEQKLQFSLWCLMSSPLLLSCDIAGMDEPTFSLLTNSDVIAIDQDALGAPPRMLKSSESCWIVRKALMDGSTAIGIFNLKDTPESLELTLTPSELEHDSRGIDLWSRENLDWSERILLQTPPHGCRLIRIS